jgi:elongin-A
VPAKTLFQKTRSEASKLQKTIYNARVLPPMPTAKTYEVAPQMAIASSSTSSSRVTVNTVIKKRPSSSTPLKLPALRNVTSESALSAKSGAVTLPTPQPLTTTRVSSSPTNTPNSSSRVTVNTVIKRRLSPAPLTLPASRNVASKPVLSAESGGTVTLPTSSPTDAPQASEPPRIAKSPNKTSIRKDPMASLFVPKRKAYSQRPV